MRTVPTHVRLGRSGIQKVLPELLQGESKTLRDVPSDHSTDKRTVGQELCLLLHQLQARARIPDVPHVPSRETHSPCAAPGQGGVSDVREVSPRLCAQCTGCRRTAAKRSDRGKRLISLENKTTFQKTVLIKS